MFQSLSDKLTGVISALKRKGALSEADIESAMREVRVALLEADVALPVVKQFSASLKEKALGAEIARGINPAQMVVKLVHDHLIELLGAESVPLNLNAVPPVVILMTGLQGSGKTTTSGKLAHYLKTKENKKVMLASLDVYRPAAQKQLEVVAGQAEAMCLSIIEGEKPLVITERALKEARLQAADVLILDTAGRLHVDEALMGELAAIKKLANPTETLLVADSLTGQDAVNIAKSFHEQIGVTGIILTRVDGDGRGGAALSMRAVTGQPIKFMGVGEKLSALEPFHPARIAGRMLDMGDVVSLVENAIANIDQEDAEKAAKRFESGQFDLDDMLKQLRQMRKMGGLTGVMGMLPGIGGIKDKMKDANIDEKMLHRQEAIILAMTAKERHDPKMLNASRKRRIAIGAGVDVAAVNRLLKQYLQMETMMKQMKKLGKRGMAMNALKNMLPR